MRKLSVIAALVLCFGLFAGAAIAQDIDLEIDPEYQEVAVGDRAAFTVSLTNNTEEMIRFALEAYIEVPEMDPIEVGTPPFLRLMGGQILTIEKSFFVPYQAPLGDYMLVAEVIIEEEIVDSETASVLVVE